jgi:hypothetical protein
MSHSVEVSMAAFSGHEERDRHRCEEFGEAELSLETPRRDLSRFHLMNRVH